MSSRRVLVTGAAGFLGANLTRELLRQGAEVHVLLRGSTDPWRIAEVWRRLSVQRADLADAATVQAAVAAARPQVLFHLAMPSGHPCDREGREQMLQACLLGTAHVLEAAADLGVARIVHLGSFLEYGPRGRPARETDPLEPVTPRGAAKAAATLWCQGFARASGLSVVVLRAFSVYGPWEDGGRLIATAVRAALEGKPMPLTAAAPRRDYVFVEDVVAACLLAAHAEVPPGEVINVGTGVLSSNQDVIAAVEAVCGRHLQIEGEYPARPVDASVCAADVEKARAVLGWQPRYSLRQGIEATMAWVRQRSGLRDSVRWERRGKQPLGEFVANPELSVVVPVYRNAATILALHARLRAVLETLAPFEVLFVDDGCPEGSRVVLERLAAEDPRVAVLVLERNVGQHRAILAGLAHARGEWVVVMDGDLQDPPEAIPELLQGAATGARAVFAGRRGAYESTGRLATSRLFKWLLHRLCGVPLDAGIFVALHRSLVRRLLELGGPRPFVVAMIGCTGLPSVSVPVSRVPRPVGVSAYNGWGRLMSAGSALIWLVLWRTRLIRPGRPLPRPAPVSARLGARFTEPSVSGRL